MDEVPEQIWIQPQYVNALIEGGGIYHLKGPSSAIIQVVRYVREDLATCTPEERAVIDIAERYHDLRMGQAGTRLTLHELMEAVQVMLTARAKSKEHK